MFLRRELYLPLVALTGILLAGCPKTNQYFEEGKKAEEIQDYDTALVDYQRALRENPMNAEYKLRAARMHAMDGQFHLQQGEKFLQQGNLEMALAEFEKAVGVDPSNMAAQQELEKANALISEKSAAGASKLAAAPPQLRSGPPQLRPQIGEIGALTMTNNSTVVFETIAKLAGLSVIFDPDFRAQRISVQLPAVTVEQALEAVALASKAYWKPLTPNVIFVAPDNPQNRRAYEDEVVKTFYLRNTLQPTDLTEIVTGLRAMLNIQKIVQMNSENAIVIRATPDQVTAAGKIIDSIDRARPEVLIHVRVLTANRDRLRQLGILPGQTVAVAFTPRPTLQPSSPSSSSGSSSSGTSGTSSTVGQVTLNNLHSLSSADWSATLPGATAEAILTDNQTHIIQDPEIRITDGEKATLMIGEKVPIATGSFQAGVGVAATGVNPLVNTQFTYEPVGVQINVQPRVHPDNQVSMKLTIEISSLAGSENIGGINQPIIAQNKIDEGEIRLTEGQASVLGGLITRTQTVNVNGIPGLAQVPLMKYLFSQNSNELQDQEVLIILTPHIVRFAPITAEDLRSLDTGSDMNIRVYREQEQALGETSGQQAPPSPNPGPGTSTPAAAPESPSGAAAQLQFNPANVVLKQGDTTTIGLQAANIKDLFSVPLLIHYNPAVIQITEIRDGGFLSGGNQSIAVVQHIDPQRGEAVVSATRQPNTPGVSGTGTLLGLVVKAVGPGTSAIQILQVNARNSQQGMIPLVSGEATIQVQ